MEHSTSAVNWQPVNQVKKPGELARDSLLHVAHGADAVAFFQWRQSVGGAEKYHSAMVPHAGPDSDVFRAVTALGQTLADLAPVAGSVRRPARAAILFDWESWWTSELDSHPSSHLRYRQEALDWYSAFLELGVRADVITTRTDLADYDLVVAPVLYVLPKSLADRLTAYCAAGGHLVTTYFSGIVDENDHVWLGGYPGPLRELLGIRIEEMAPLADGESVRLDDGSTATLWTDQISLLDPDVSVLAGYASGDQAGRPAITRRTLPGAGSAAYVSTRLGRRLGPLLARLLDAAGVHSELPAAARGRVELAVRVNDAGVYWFLVNRTDQPVVMPMTAGQILVGGGETGTVTLAARGVAVIHRDR